VASLSPGRGAANGGAGRVMGAAGSGGAVTIRQNSQDSQDGVA
jgi:hypothetical protein